MSFSTISSTVNWETMEDVPAYTLIGQFGSDTRDQLLTLSPIDQRDLLKYFYLNQSEGKVYTKKLLDRDNLCDDVGFCCDQLELCILQFKLFLHDVSDQLPKSQTIKILVKDSNDHAPLFTPNEVSLKIGESSPRNSVFHLDFAKDPDSLQNTVQRYEIINSHLHREFSLKTEERVNAAKSNSFGGIVYKEITSLMLVLNVVLDREKRDYYELAIRAIDGAHPALSGTVTLKITVGDQNDNGPSFVNETYVVDVNEGMGNLPLLILTVHAKDSDIGLNAKVVYNFDHGVSKQLKQMFLINSETGEIHLTKLLDYEEKDRYKFLVVASDSLGHPVSSTATVVVRVQDLNDEVPKIVIGYVAREVKDYKPLGNDGADIQPSLPSNGNGKIIQRAQIRENLPPSTFLAYFTVHDRDKGLNGQTSCYVAEEYAQMFELKDKRLMSDNSYNNQGYKSELDNTDGEDNYQAVSAFLLVTMISFDREETATTNVRIICSDMGSPAPQTSHLDFPIDILDINDNSAVLTIDTNQKLSMAEKQPIGTRLLQVHARDPDEAENGTVTFQLVESTTNEPNLFKIDPLSGWITSQSVIDREQNYEPLNSVSVLVIATDQGKPQMTGSLLLNISIEDVNDNEPTFSESPMNFYVTENNPANTRIHEIQVQDKDLRNNLKLEIRSLKQYQNVPFTVWKSLPDVYSPISESRFYLNTTRSLDYERVSSYVFDLVAIDDADGRMYIVTASVTVHVEDENDNAPMIIYPRDDNRTILLSNLEPRLHEVVKITATDKDKGPESGLCTFQLISKSGFLEIDPNTGSIKVQRLMTDHDIGAHSVTVIVKDNGSPPKEARVQLIIAVNSSLPHDKLDGGILAGDTNGSWFGYRYGWSSDNLLIIGLILVFLLFLGGISGIIYRRHCKNRVAAIVIPEFFYCCNKWKLNVFTTRSEKRQKRCSNASGCLQSENDAMQEQGASNTRDKMFGTFSDDGRMRNLFEFQHCPSGTLTRHNVHGSTSLYSLSGHTSSSRPPAYRPGAAVPMDSSACSFREINDTESRDGFTVNARYEQIGYDGDNAVFVGLDNRNKSPATKSNSMSAGSKSTLLSSYYKHTPKNQMHECNFESQSSKQSTSSSSSKQPTTSNNHLKNASIDKSSGSNKFNLNYHQLQKGDQTINLYPDYDLVAASPMIYGVARDQHGVNCAPSNCYQTLTRSGAPTSGLNVTLCKNLCTIPSNHTGHFGSARSIGDIAKINSKNTNLVNDLHSVQSKPFNFDTNTTIQTSGCGTLKQSNFGQGNNANKYDTLKQQIQHSNLSTSSSLSSNLIFDSDISYPKTFQNIEASFV